MSFSITPENDPPIAGDDVLAGIAEDSEARVIPISSLLANDLPGPTNEFTQSLTFSLGDVTGGAAGVFSGNVIFTPATNYFGSAGFSYTVHDDGTTAGQPDPRTANADVSLTISEVNDPPVGENDVLPGIAEDSAEKAIPFAVLLANDLPGPANEAHQALDIVNATVVSGGSVRISGTNILFTPAPDFVGTASFVYTVQDDGLTGGVPDPRFDTSIAEFPIIAVNDPPIVQDDLLSSIPEDSGPLVIPWDSLLQNDIPGPTNENNQLLTIVSVGNATGGNATISSNRIIFTVSSNYNGRAGFTYSVQDNGLSDGANDPKRADAEVIFDVLPVNDVPAASSQSVSLNEDTSILISLTGSDGDPEVIQTLSVQITDPPDHGTLSPANEQSYLYTPSPNYAGMDSFQFTVTDDANAGPPINLTSAPATISIEIRSAADAPTVTPAITREGQQTTGGLVISPNSADLDVSHYKITGIINGTLFQNNGTTQIPEGAFVTLAQGLAGLKFTPTAGLYNPQASFSFDVQAAVNSLGARLRDASSASIIVIPNEDFGDAPEPSYPTILTNDGARHVVLSTGPTLYLGSIVPDTELDGQPSNATGDDLSGTDDEDGVSLPETIVQGQTYSLSVQAAGAGLFSAWIDWNQNGSWNDPGDQVLLNERLVNESVTFNLTAPIFTAAGQTFVRFRFSTASGLGPTGLAPDGEVEDYVLTLTTNRAPVARMDTLVRYVNESAKITDIEVLANDSDLDGDMLAILSVPSVLPSGARVKRDSGWIIYEPPAGFYLPESFPYTLSDGRGGTAVGIINVVVQGGTGGTSANRFDIELTDGGVILRFNGVPGRSYEIQTTPNLSSPWARHGTGVQIARPDGTISIMESTLSSPRFYRALQR